MSAITIHDFLWLPGVKPYIDNHMDDHGECGVYVPKYRHIVVGYHWKPRRSIVDFL